VRATSNYKPGVVYSLSEDMRIYFEQEEVFDISWRNLKLHGGVSEGGEAGVFSRPPDLEVFSTSPSSWKRHGRVRLDLFRNVLQTPNGDDRPVAGPCCPPFENARINQLVEQDERTICLRQGKSSR
jgi:hypothetical protein